MNPPGYQGRSISPGGLLHPIQTLDFEQVQVQLQIAPLTAENMAAFLQADEARLKQLLNNRDTALPRRAVVILDGSNQLVPPPAVRKLQAEWIKRNEHVLRTVIYSMGVVIPNTIARGAFTAVMWLAGDRVPWEMVAHPDLATAIQWAIAEAKSHGATVSEELVRDGIGAVERHRAQLAGRGTARALRSA